MEPVSGVKATQGVESELADTGKPSSLASVAKPDV